MPVFIRFFMLLSAFVVLPAMAAGPQRIVSLGLCTDQLLMLLAERGQIASVSSWAKDANMSYMAANVGDLPLNDASVEQILRLQPDLVVASDFVARDTVGFLRQLGVTVKQVPVATSIDEIYSLINDFGAWTGNSRRAGSIVQQMRARLDEIERKYADRPDKSVIIYAPNGFTIGSNTLENDLFKHAGYRNLAAEMGITGFRSISLESLIAADPDVLQIDRSLSRQASLATAMLTHPVLEKLLRKREFLDIPVKLRICAGPMIVDAVEMMAARR